jgi:cytidylate kinase
MVIAIDGPGGVGKSTVTRGVAAALGYEYLDTGSTYRAATFAVLEAGVDPEDAVAVLDVVRHCAIEYLDGAIHLDGYPVPDAVRSPEVTAAVSMVSAYPEVRALVVEMQRDWVASRGGSAVVEGRDIGTVVFPEALVKVFLTARPEVRAARRSGDAEAAGKDVEVIAAELEQRDHYDSTREISPLQPAGDATIVDTSDLDADGVISAVLDLVATAKGRQAHGPF